MSPSTLALRVLISDTVGPLLPEEGMSLLFGVPVQQIVEHRGVGRDGTIMLPDALVQAGRRRAKEVRMHTGQDEMVSSLHYWAEKDHGRAC